MVEEWVTSQWIEDYCNLMDQILLESRLKEGIMKYRDHKGGLSESMQTVVEITSIQELAEHIGKVYNLNEGEIENIKFQNCGFDGRTGWNTYYVLFKTKEMNDFVVAGMSDSEIIDHEITLDLSSPIKHDNTDYYNAMKKGKWVSSKPLKYNKTMNKITKEELFKDFLPSERLTVKKLKEFINEQQLSDDAMIVIQRVEDVYYEKHGWQVYTKEPDYINNYGYAIPPLTSRNLNEPFLEEYRPARNCVKYNDEGDDILFIHLHL